MSSRNGRRANITGIAKACGVSAMTVSRALRDDPRVLETTRRRILAAADRAGYQPNARAGRPRAVTKNVRPSVEVVLSVSQAPVSSFHYQLLLSIERELVRRGCDCVVRTCSDDYAQFLSLGESLRVSRALATLVVGHYPVEQLRTILQAVPQALLVDQSGDPTLEGPYEYVAFDNVEAARLAVRHLLDIGQRRILLITGKPEHYFSREIEQGYREVLATQGVPLENGWIRRADFTADGARSVLAQAMDERLPFDAVFTNDEMATGVLRLLFEKNQRVPSDVAVVGCDGLPMGLQTIPTLTTVALDYVALGQLAVEKALAKREPGAPLCRMRLIPRLVVRESTGNTHDSKPNT